MMIKKGNNPEAPGKRMNGRINIHHQADIDGQSHAPTPGQDHDQGHILDHVQDQGPVLGLEPGIGPIPGLGPDPGLHDLRHLLPGSLHMKDLDQR